jgi:hypothetical protein
MIDLTSIAFRSDTSRVHLIPDTDGHEMRWLFSITERAYPGDDYEHEHRDAEHEHEEMREHVGCTQSVGRRRS